MRIGSEIIRYINIKSSMAKLRYWRDHNGPEIDFVIDRGKDFILNFAVDIVARASEVLKIRAYGARSRCLLRNLGLS